MAGCAIRASFAGHTDIGASADHALTFNTDHPMAADQDCEILHADKGYDSNAIRRQVENGGAVPKIAPKSNRKWKNCFSPFLYGNRNAIERVFCRLKDFRRISTSYDRNAANFHGVVCIAATVSYWL